MFSGKRVGTEVLLDNDDNDTIEIEMNRGQRKEGKRGNLPVMSGFSPVVKSIGSRSTVYCEGPCATSKLETRPRASNPVITSHLDLDVGIKTSAKVPRRGNLLYRIVRLLS